jgi:hypothetical protein
VLPENCGGRIDNENMNNRLFLPHPTATESAIYFGMPFAKDEDFA